MRRVASYNIPVTVNSTCGGFAAERRAGGQEISIETAAGGAAAGRSAATAGSDTFTADEGSSRGLV